MYEVVFDKTFAKKLQKLTKNDSALKTRIRQKLKILAKSPTRSSLRLHKLSGSNNWSISVNRSIRILVTFKEDMILCNDIGTHDEVY